MLYKPWLMIEMSVPLTQRENIRCASTYLARAVGVVLGVDPGTVMELINTGKIRIQRTPDPRLGDYGFAIHVLLKGVEQARWNDVGTLIAREFLSAAKDTCHIEDAFFVNGYVNVVFDYHKILRELATDWSTGALNERLTKVGGGQRVIVEHTSANPVHPLHIGSGRNSVLGDTYARLLKRLGFDVETRFYVNDLGRQMAVLAYGVLVIRSKGIKKPTNMKVDHWYGAIYALTNIIMELDRLKNEVKNFIEVVLSRSSDLLELISRTPIGEQYPELVLTLRGLVDKRGLNVDILKQLKKLHRLLKNLAKSTTNEQLKNAMEILIGDLEKLRETYKEYVSYVKAEARLAYMYPDLHAALKSGIESYEKAESTIRDLMTRAEREDPQVIALFREVAEDVLEGFRQTLRNINIVFDGFDYESSRDVVELAHKVVEDLLNTRYARVVQGGAVEVDLNRAAEEIDYVKKLFYPDQAGRFIVRRSDGTTLYVTRDIAYTILKFRKYGAVRVYNVIAVEQSREQKQLKAVLYVLGYKNESENLYHFGYEMVHLKDMRMSGRRGTYYTVDELLVDMTSKMLKKLEEREDNPLLDPTEALTTARSLAIANARALLLSVEPGKVLVFDTEKIEALDYASIIEYAFVRAQGILRTLLGQEPLENVPALLEVLKNTLIRLSELKPLPLSLEEKTLIEHLQGYEETLVEAYRELKPSKILEYAVELSSSFNKFYEKHPVVKEPDDRRRFVRIIITALVLLVLSDLMNLMGMPKLQRM